MMLTKEQQQALNAMCNGDMTVTALSAYLYKSQILINSIESESASNETTVHLQQGVERGHYVHMRRVVLH